MYDLMIKAISPTLVFFCILAPVRSDELCVTVTGSGVRDGSDWNNALPRTFTPERGNTYYIADGDYGGSRSWNVANSGSSVIVLKKATVSDHATDAGWSNDMGDGLAEWEKWSVSSDYWIFDGQQGGGPGDWNFASGLGFRLYAIGDKDRLVLLRGEGTRRSLEFHHIDIESDRVIKGSQPLRGFQSTTVPIADVLISHCAFRNITNVPIYVSDTNGFMVQYCYFYRNLSTPKYHSEMNSRNGLGTNETWRWNLFDDIKGTAVFAGLVSVRSAVDGIAIYGNVFYDSVTPIWYYNAGGKYSYMNNARIYNNTFVGNGGYNNSQGAFKIESGTGNVARNNLFYENDFNTFQFQGFDALSHVWAARNIRSSAGNADRDAEILSFHSDGQLGRGDPFENYDPEDILSSNLAAETAAGFDSSSELPGNGYDMFGNPRGGDGNWDRGAIEFNAVDDN